MKEKRRCKAKKVPFRELGGFYHFRHDGSIHVVLARPVTCRGAEYNAVRWNGILESVLMDQLVEPIVILKITYGPLAKGSEA